jgi:hypothetical protein
MEGLETNDKAAAEAREISRELNRQLASLNRSVRALTWAVGVLVAIFLVWILWALITYVANTRVEIVKPVPESSVPGK